MDPVAAFFSALDRGDSEAVRLALHPYLRWARADGTVVKGRKRVVAMLSECRPAPPSAVQTRDGQIYRWTE